MEHRLHNRARIRIGAEITFRGVRIDNLYTRDISTAGVFVELDASSLPLLSLVQVALNDVNNGVQIAPMDMLVIHKSDTGVGLMAVREETGINEIKRAHNVNIPSRVHQSRYAYLP